MRNLRSLRSLLAVCAFALVAVPASACTVSSAHVQGRFDDAGQFVVTKMLDAHGQPIAADGFVCKALTTEDGVALDTQDGTVYVVGDVDFEARSLHVRRYTKDAAVAAAAVAHAQAGVQVASAGDGCASKAASASCTAAKGASAAAAGAKGCCSGAAATAAGAKSAGAGACCSGAKGAAAKAASAGASCSGAAKAASAGSSCSGAAKAASAGAHCSGAAKAASAGSSCSGAKDAAAETASAPVGQQVVFAVSGMTCGGCEAKVEAAVTAMKLDGVTGCKASHQDGQAVLTLADGAEIDVDAVAKAISATGFEAEVPKAADEKAATEETTSTM